MEILLNLVWAALTLAIFALALRAGSSGAKDRSRQIIALIVLVAILFPVISVSDDLMAIQNATEADSLFRRDDVGAAPLHMFLPVAVLTVPILTDLPLTSQVRLAIDPERLPVPDFPLLPSTGIRPPPYS